MNTLVSLFAGAGGLDIGLEQAGLTTVTATDTDFDCVETLNTNKNNLLRIRGAKNRCLSECRIVRSDVSELTGSDLRPAGEGRRWVPDVLAGGPPCQPFSSSGKQQSVLEIRGRLFLHFVRLATELRPRAVLFENVRGLVTARGVNGEPGEALADVKESFERVGYATSFALLNAADYGGPQRRVRLFMMATRDVPVPVFPSAPYARHPQDDLFGCAKPWVTLGEFLSEMPEPKPEEIVRPTESLAELLDQVPPGSGVKSPGRAEPTRPGGHWGYRQGTFVADPDLPARTVTASSSQDWVRTQDGSLRRLTLRECAALQGFPVGWKFTGTKASQFRQVGNAVPSIFGLVLGRALVDALGQRRVRKPQSAPIPAYMDAAVEYTRRDHDRNSVARTRTNAILRQLATPSEVA